MAAEKLPMAPSKTWEMIDMLEEYKKNSSDPELQLKIKEVIDAVMKDTKRILQSQFPEK